MDHHAHHMMDHGDMDMPGHDMPAMCSMNMLFTWDTTNLCIVFASWHIRSTVGLVFSLLAVVLIGMGYEALRAGTRRYEIVMGQRLEAYPNDSVTETAPLAAWATGQNKARVQKQVRLVKAVLYAVQTFYAFMLMLVFMTYNGWVMAAVTLGAFLGHLTFGAETSVTKETQCH
ncbi:Ctr copper transporter family-domain-containing protein [Coniella lustricola]|uniref:Copper transport protein n=1 Tax=Coniella lustricola TaxID=2025994 RepID=A0A2T2ZV77_9PEZI|nr:Ctr copper transporter family-domain-containing protein [Coniella lustricola]